MMTRKDFAEIQQRIVALGYSEDEAGTLAGSLGDDIEFDSETHQLIARDANNQVVLLPLSVLGEETD